VDPAEITRLTAEALWLALLVSAPVLIASLVTGTLIGLLQAVTQVQEHTVSFVPRLIVVGLVLALGGEWMGGELVRFTTGLWESIPGLVR
jgi:flagellar biosynthetic protein FliQ